MVALQDSVRLIRRITLFVLLLITSFAGFSFDTSEYFPLESGNQWTYRLNGNLIHTETVLAGSVFVNGVSTLVVQDSDGIMTFFTNDANGWRLYRNFEKAVDFGDGVGRDFTVNYVPPIQFAAADVNIGDVFSASGTITVEIAGLGSFTLNHTFSANIETLENISVPLGNFPAVKVRLSLNIQGTISGTAVNETEVDTFWLAKHVGPVKFTQELIGEGIDSFELIAVSVDSDDDGINVIDDNCPTISSPNQNDNDDDGLGDICDSDDDNDSSPDSVDNCPFIVNSGQENNDGDTTGDACDSDDDGDGIADNLDAFPLNADESVDTDSDGMGDSFEQIHGFDPLIASDASQDADSDGLTNLDEFMAGSDPNDANSPVVDLNVVLVSAVLPSSRSVTIGSVATAFATIINGGTATATNCWLSPMTSIPADFFFQTTNPATNALSGTRNTAIDITAGAFQTFVFGFTPTAAFDSTDVQIQYRCANANAAGVVIGLNSLLLSASATPIPDIVALGATTTNDGIVHIPGTTGTGFFAVASVNVGASDNLIVSVDTGDATLPIVTSLCQTDPVTGACINPTTPTTGDVTLTINANETPTLAVFVAGTENIALDAAFKRIFLRFKDASGVTHGSTSVAVQTD